MVLVFGMVVVGCDEDNTGYQLEYYKITSSTYNNRPSGVTAEEHLSYVKRASGTGNKINYWTTSYDSLEKKILEVSGYYSISASFKTAIQEQYATVSYSGPGLWNPNSDYWFFYINNNNNK